MQAIRDRAHELKRNLVTLYLAARDRRTPWYAKALLIGIVAYALSPVDLIPDFIPVLGYMDDLLLLPMCIYIAIKIIPEPVLAECRERAAAMPEKLPKNRTAAIVIIVLWIAAAAAMAIYLWRTMRG